jgi:hypothetical protein
MSTLGLHRGPYNGMFVKDLDTDLSFVSRRRAITTSLYKEQHLCSFVERDLNAMIGQMPLFWLVNVIGGLKATRQHHVRVLLRFVLRSMRYSERVTHSIIYVSMTSGLKH